MILKRVEHHIKIDPITTLTLLHHELPQTLALKENNKVLFLLFRFQTEKYMLLLNFQKTLMAIL
jgi:hypothetical protein